MTKTLTNKKEKKKKKSITDWDELSSHLSMYLICNLHYYQHHYYPPPPHHLKLFEFHRTGSYQLAHACAMSKGRRSKHFSSSINIASSWPQWVHWWIDWLPNPLPPWYIRISMVEFVLNLWSFLNWLAQFCR